MIRRLALLLAGIVLALAPVAAEASRFRLLRQPTGVVVRVYPDQVVARSMQDVWDVTYDAGRNLALTKTPLLNAADLPAGSSVVGTTVNLGSGTLTGWDFTGYGVRVDGNKTVVCNHCRFRFSGGDGPILGVGMASSVKNPNLTFSCDRCEFDGTFVSTSQRGAVKSYGNLYLNRVWFHDGAQNHLLSSGGVLSIADSYFQSPAKATNGGTDYSGHIENIHILDGTATLTRVVFDVTDGIPTGIIGGWTAPGFFAQAFTGDVNVTADRIIIRGGKTVIGTTAGGVGATHPYQVKQGPEPLTFTSTTTISGSLLEKGTSCCAYYVTAGGADSVDGGGNYDLTTGEAINLD